MTDLIQIRTSSFDGQEVQAVRSRALYEFLGLRKQNYLRWINESVVANGVEGTDYVPYVLLEELSNEYLLSIDFAKSLSMMSKSEKGKEVRQYFINVEKSFKKIIESPRVPQTYLEALEAHVQTLKQLETTGEKLLQAENKIAVLSHSGKLYTTTEIAKELGMQSAMELNKALEEQQIQFKINGTWVLKAWHMKKGYTSTKQLMVNDRVIYDTKWTQTGREFILSKFSNLQ